MRPRRVAGPHSIALDLTSAPLPTAMTLARASSAHHYDASGLLVSAAANTPRFDHDPVSLTPRGLLLEGAASNQLLHSTGYTQSYWQKQNFGSAGLVPVVTANATQAPDGTMTASRVVLNAVNGSGQSSLQTQTIALPAAAYCLSVWMKVAPAEADALVRLRIDYTGGAVAENVLVTQIWTRFSLTTATLPDLKSAAIAKLRPSTATATATTLHIWGAQLETGGLATSYIATAGTVQLRAADIAGTQGLSGTYDVGVTYGDDSGATLPAQVVAEGYWPALVKSRVKGLVFTPTG